MLRRGCALIVVCFVTLFAAYLAFFTRYFEWPGNLIAAFSGALFGGIGISSLGQVGWAWRDMRAFARKRRGAARQAMESWSPPQAPFVRSVPR